jgi:pseudaminic acid biosynthesis-associated methylase
MSSSSNRIPTREPGSQETAQTAVWTGDFGRTYTDRNTLDVEGVDHLYQNNYGISKSEINAAFLRGIAKDASFLEAGCNSGNQLLLLKQMGYTNISGVEIQPYALENARRRLPGVTLKQGSLLSIPFEDASFDVVFTTVVLIHIAPRDLPRAMDEIYRCSRQYIWGLEYYAPSPTEVLYRGHTDLLWKMDYARQYLERFSDLELVMERRLPYLENSNVDSVFLLKKKTMGAANSAELS